MSLTSFPLTSALKRLQARSQEAHYSSKAKKRVIFDKTAVKMAEFQEAKTANKYRKTLDLGSASTWKQWNLELFNATFEKDKYHELSDYLDGIYRIPPLERREADLFENLLQVSDTITEDDLKAFFHDENVKAKVNTSLLAVFYITLAHLFESSSRDAIELKRIKESGKRADSKAKRDATKQEGQAPPARDEMIDGDGSSGILDQLSDMSLSRPTTSGSGTFIPGIPCTLQALQEMEGPARALMLLSGQEPSGYTTAERVRDIADWSTISSDHFRSFQSVLPTSEPVVDTTSNENGGDGFSKSFPSSISSLPSVLEAPEDDVQAMQNNLIMGFLGHMYWHGGIPVPFATKKQFWLDYRSSDSTSFSCYLPGRDCKDRRPDRINVRSDGAFVLMAGRARSNNQQRLIWPRQKSVIAFEAKRLGIRSEDKAGRKNVQHITPSEAKARAGQIFAEMLGIVCHEEYYSQGDQTAFVIHISGVFVSIYWAEFPAKYLRKVHRGTSNDLEQIEIKHTKPLALYDHEQRRHFFIMLMHLLRFAADGRANIGELRRNGSKIHQERDELSLPTQAQMEYPELMTWMRSGYTSYLWDQTPDTCAFLSDFNRN